MNIIFKIIIITCILCTHNHVLEVVRVCFIGRNTLIYEELIDQTSHGFLDGTTFEKIFTFFYLATKDLYNEGALGGDGSEYRTLCDLLICLIGLVGCEDLPIIIIKIKHIC